MKRLVIAVTTVFTAILLFSAGVFASTYITWDGDVDLADSEESVNEILDILDRVHQDKLTAEQALEELEALNPVGLAKKNKELRERVTELERLNDGMTVEIGSLNEYIAILEGEVEKANKAADNHKTFTDQALEEAKQYEGGE